MDLFVSEFPRKLKDLRERHPEFKNSTEFYKALGVSQPTGSRLESGQSEPDLSFLNKLVEIFPDEGRALMPGWDEPRFSIAEPETAYVTGVLPEHVQEAYKVVREALDAAKADISTMDQDRIGLVIGLAAEEIARGNRAEARQTLLRRAEVLLGLKNP
jgi:transcriptional regulator with XRE-family HTH domain